MVRKFVTQILTMTTVWQIVSFNEVWTTKASQLNASSSTKRPSSEIGQLSRLSLRKRLTALEFVNSAM